MAPAHILHHTYTKPERKTYTTYMYTKGVASCNIVAVDSEGLGDSVSMITVFMVFNIATLRPTQGTFSAD